MDNVEKKLLELLDEHRQSQEPERRFYEVDLPEFPVNALPPNLREFTEAVAANVQVSPDMVAVPLLAALCVPLQNRFVVRVDSAYAEPLCLYTLTIARPSERKSAIISILEKPLWEWQRVMNDDLPEGKKPVTLYVTDATPEKLARLMKENHGAIALLSDEPDALAVAAGLRYGKSRNLGLMLQAWSAGRVMMQRAVDDKRIDISRAVMSVAVMSQPSFVEALMKDAEMSNRGFMQRFLYALPLSKVGNRSFRKPEIPQILLDEYHQLITDFLQMSAEELREIRLSKGAANFADSYFWEVEQKISENPVLEGWMGKIFGQFLRIAGIFHCAMWQTKAAEKEMEWNTMVYASKVANYFMKHAKAVFTDIETPEAVRFARELYRKILNAKMDIFTKTDLRKVTGGNVAKKLVRDALTLLVKAGYLGCIAGKEATVEARVEAKNAQFSVPALIGAENEEPLPKFV